MQMLKYKMRFEHQKPSLCMPEANECEMMARKLRYHVHWLTVSSDSESTIFSGSSDRASAEEH